MSAVCRACRGRHGRVVLDLGHQPACDHFPLVSDPGPDPVHPLQMWLCLACGLAQLLDDPTVPEEPRGTEPAALVEQAADAVRRVAAAGLLPAGARVAEYGSPHGGSWLELLAERGLRPVAGDEPAEVVLDCFGLMHSQDQSGALAERAARLTDGGVLLLQYHSLATIVRCGQWNALRHGHYAYYSTPALVGMLEVAGLSPYTAWMFDLYGGTILLAATKGRRPVEAAIPALLAGESSLGICDVEVFEGLQQQVSTSADALRGWLEQQREQGRTVLGYGAASRAVSLLSAGGIGQDLLPAVADAAPAKAGRRMPGSAIPVISPAELVAAAPDAVLLFVPDLIDEVRRALPEVEAGGGHWVIAEPTPTPAGAAGQSAPSALSVPPHHLLGGEREDAAMSADTHTSSKVHSGQLPARSAALAGRAAAPVSVGLPVYNGEPYLSRSLDSLLAQQDVDFELHIADNCSTDATEQICREAAAKDSRVRYRRRERNVGVTENHNRLVAEVPGRYFAWAAADDAYHPDRLNRLLEAMTDNQRAVVAFSSARQIDAEDRTVGSWSNPCRVDHPDPVVRLADLIGREHENYHIYGLFRREVLLRTQLLAPVKNSDRILVAELALHGPFVELAEELLFHRLHERRLTQSTTQRDWYRTQRLDGRRVVLPNVEEAGWYVRAVLRSPLPGPERAKALLALYPWFKVNAVPMARNVVRAAVDGAKLLGVPGRPVRKDLGTR